MPLLTPSLCTLQEKNKGYAATANTVGQTAGYFVAFTGFLALQTYNICTLAQFLNFWAVVFLVTTLLVWFMKHEKPEKDDMVEGVVEVYQQLYCAPAAPALPFTAFPLGRSLQLRAAGKACCGRKQHLHPTAFRCVTTPSVAEMHFVWLTSPACDNTDIMKLPAIQKLVWLDLGGSFALRSHSNHSVLMCPGAAAAAAVLAGGGALHLQARVLGGTGRDWAEADGVRGAEGAHGVDHDSDHPGQHPAALSHRGLDRVRSIDHHHRPIALPGASTHRPGENAPDAARALHTYPACSRLLPLVVVLPAVVLLPLAIDLV